jgi:PAS domain S-box-containing protein
LCYRKKRAAVGQRELTETLSQLADCGHSDGADHIGSRRVETKFQSLEGANTEFLRSCDECAKIADALQAGSDSLQLDAIINSIPDVIAVQGPDHTIIRLNEAGYRFFDTTAEKAVGKKCHELMGREEPCDFCPGPWIIETRKPAREERFIERTGAWLDLRHYPVLDAAGEVIWIIEHIRDITEQKRTDNALRIALADSRKSREKINAIVKSITDGLIVTDLNDLIVMANPAAEALLGRPRADIYNRSLESVIQDRNPDFSLSIFDTGELAAQEFDIELPEKNGRPCVLRVQVSIIMDEQESPCGHIYTLRDMTREWELDRLKKDFLTTVSHELRTPLATILGFSELLLQGNFSPAEQKEFLGYVYEKAESLAQLVEELLDIGRLEEGRGLELNLEICRMENIFLRAIRGFQSCTRRHAIETDFPEQPVDLALDKAKIERVVENLLSNAIKYSPSGGPIRITGRPTDSGDFHITIADQGIGMTPEQVERIFDKFYRADTSNTAIGGTGVGMSIVKNIIQAHRGSIWVESAPGVGTTVHLLLPIRQVESPSRPSPLTHFQIFHPKHRNF